MCTFQRGSISCAGNGQRQGQFLLCSVEIVPSSLPECLGSAPLRLLPPIWDRNVATQSLILGLLISLKSIFFFNRCFQNNEALGRTHYWNAGGPPMLSTFVYLSAQSWVLRKVVLFILQITEHPRPGGQRRVGPSKLSGPCRGPAVSVPRNHGLPYDLWAGSPSSKVSSWSLIHRTIPGICLIFKFICLLV